MRFRILGPVEAWTDCGEPVRLPPKPRALLAVLLVHAGALVSLGRLTGAIWSRGAPPSAPRMIRTYVSTLRQSLRLPRQDGLPRLSALDDAYCMEVAPGDLDMLVFDELAERGRRALAGGDAASSGQVRPLLPGAPDCTVIVTSRSRLPGLGAQRADAEPPVGTTFGTGGTAATAIVPAAPGVSAEDAAALVQPDDKILVAGGASRITGRRSGVTDGFVGRIKTNGSPDTTFGIGDGPA